MDKKSGFALVEERTKKVDRMLMRLFTEHYAGGVKDWALLAVGGYGRRDLCPFSDIDILILIGKRKKPREVEEILGNMIYPLWNEGLQASYSVRRVAEAAIDARADFFLKTALLDARLLCGAQSVLDELEEALAKKRLFYNREKVFIADLDEHERMRHEQHGDASYILEPDLKDGQGGLRDHHSLMWLIKETLGLTNLNDLQELGMLSTIDIKELMDALDFLLRVRVALHNEAGRKQDRLSFEYQEALAPQFTDKVGDVEDKIEVFMQQFHRGALIIKSVYDAVFLNVKARLKLLPGKLHQLIDEDFELSHDLLVIRHPEKIPQDPALMIKAFAHCARMRTSLHPFARALIRANIDLVFKVRRSVAAKRDFLDIIQSDQAQPVLTSMLETGVLERFIPEIEHIKGRMQFDVYHTLTVDMHSIHTLEELKALERSEKELFSRVNEPDVLYLSAFLHDIGKGRGGRHAEQGGIIGYNIAHWLGLHGRRLEQVRFLILNHLLLADTALRRDLSEEKVVFEFARQMGNPERLAMLALVTIADSKATGPSGWNDWKAALIQDLTQKTLHILEKGDLKKHRAVANLDRKWEELVERTPHEAGKDVPGLWALPQAYVLAHTVDHMITHLKMSKLIGGLEDVQVDIQPKGSHFLLTLIARDRPGLFALLTGMLACKHIDIHSAKIFTWADGTAVDHFEVSPPWPDYHEWDQLVALFKQISTGEFDLHAGLRELKPLLNSRRQLNLTARPKVVVNNDTSDFYTLIEVYAPDRLGMLAGIAHAIHSLDLGVHRAVIASKADLVADIFYVVDNQGEKIEDEKTIKTVMAGITQAVAQRLF